jgi:hypothetical protein
VLDARRERRRVDERGICVVNILFLTTTRTVENGCRLNS